MERLSTQAKRRSLRRQLASPHQKAVKSETIPGKLAQRRVYGPAPASTPPMRPTGRSETVAGYVEWQRDGYLIADGERVRWTPNTRLKVGGVASPRAIPLGYELKATGHRTGDGFLIADLLEAKPNGVAAYEREVYQATNELEARWMAEGAVSDFDRGGGQRRTGRYRSVWTPGRTSSAYSGAPCSTICADRQFEGQCCSNTFLERQGDGQRRHLGQPRYPRRSFR